MAPDRDPRLREGRLYRALIGLAEEVVANAKAAREMTAKMRGKDPFNAMTIAARREEIAHYCGLGEKSAAFKQGQRFRAGIEGRISVLMRGRGMKRCRAEGTERFALFVGAAVLANNLMIIAALLTKRSSRRRK
jgi:hypothetical protein